MKKCKKCGVMLNENDLDLCDDCSKELWEVARERAIKNYEAEYGEGSWEEAERYEREDNVFAMYFRMASKL